MDCRSTAVDGGGRGRPTTTADDDGAVGACAANLYIYGVRDG